MNDIKLYKLEDEDLSRPIDLLIDINVDKEMQFHRYYLFSCIQEFKRVKSINMLLAYLNRCSMHITLIKNTDELLEIYNTILKSDDIINSSFKNDRGNDYFRKYYGEYISSSLADIVSFDRNIIYNYVSKEIESNYGYKREK